MRPRRGGAINHASGRSSQPSTPATPRDRKFATTMGNAALRGPAVEERLTQPGRLVRQLSDLDSDRLRRPCAVLRRCRGGRPRRGVPHLLPLLPELESIQVLRQRDLHRVLRAADAVEGFQSCPLPILQNDSLRCRIPR